MRIIIICLILSFAAYGCKKNEVVPNVDHSTKYYPLADGYTWIYAVDSVIFYGNLTQKPDTINYHVRHEIIGTIQNAEGVYSFTVEKSIKTSEEGKFKFDRTFGIQKSKLALTYNNVDTRIPVLTFPISNEKEWNGNVYTEKDEWNITSGKTNEVECFYKDVHLPKTVEGTLYDSISTVVRSKEENAINSRYTNEIFAANIGLVSKYFENLENFDTQDPKGSIYTYTLLSFEK